MRYQYFKCAFLSERAVRRLGISAGRLIWSLEVPFIFFAKPSALILPRCCFALALIWDMTASTDFEVTSISIFWLVLILIRVLAIIKVETISKSHRDV
jgi:hypothetical protein